MYESPMDDSFNVVKYIVGASCIKYHTLHTIMEKDRIMTDKVAFHIDVDAILYRLYRERNMDAVDAMDRDAFKINLIVSLLNVIGHYRRFISTHLRMDNEIFVYWSAKAPKFNTERIEGYDVNIPWKIAGRYAYMRDAVYETLMTLSQLSAYYPELYFINTGSLCKYATMDLVTKSDNPHLGSKDVSRYHIVFSRNMLTLQMLNEDTAVLHNARDKSYIVYDDQFKRYLTNQSSGKKGVYSTTKDALPMVFALGGLIDVGVKGTPLVEGFYRVLNMFEKIYSKTINPEEANAILMSPELTLRKLREVLPKAKHGIIDELLRNGEISRRYEAFSLEFVYNSFSEAFLDSVSNQIYSLVDTVARDSMNEILTSMGEDVELIQLDSLVKNKGE